MNLIPMLMTFLKMPFWEFKLKSFNIEKSESEDEPTIPKAFIEIFTNLMSAYVGCQL